MQMDSVLVFILAMMVAFLIYFIRKMVTGHSSETTTKDWLLYFLIAPLMIAAFLGSFFYADSKGIEEILAIPSQMDILGRARLASRCPFYCFAKTSLAEGKLLLADGSGRPSRNGCGVLLDEPNVWTDNNPTVTGFSRVRSGASPIRSQTRGSTPR